MADRLRTRRFPVLWQVNARTTVRHLGPGATLDDLDDAQLDRLLPVGVDWLYLLGVWQTGAAGREVSRRNPDIRRSCEEALPDVRDDDICGSCFAVTGYQVHERLGGDAALARLRARLAARGIALMLDFVPNHTAPDHPWVAAHPKRYITGTEADLDAAPGDWTEVATATGERIVAYGRDPYFAGWPDTLQLDYSRPKVRSAMTKALLTAASHGDGLRCDMAMLLLPDVFERTWGKTIEPFWPDALAAVRAEQPGFTFLAEVYWDREYDLQQQGFDATYDKRLYDRLVGDLGSVRGHLQADPGYQARSARFLENHDEPRAAATFGVGDRHRAAAVISYLVPGLRFFEDGQPEAADIHVPVHLCRAPDEPLRNDLRGFYDQLLAVLADPVVHDGTWQLAEVTAAWDGNSSHERIVAFTWSTADGELRYLVAVNLADTPAQGYVHLGDAALAGRTVTLTDRLGAEHHERDGDELRRSGLYLDVVPWAHPVFAVTSATHQIRT
ncbi:alpha-amylase family glycosyl hydrolase [Aquihabitans sp. McL0605]|uniref:alpha-amylase family glycosyl hydrolase n=1 Tax=Aquihabitans sp. McL0605 TaxID=3415671 RepID=UPI003CE77859